jgi:formylglycine-generating enzyme required for sulfatase activity
MRFKLSAIVLLAFVSAASLSLPPGDSFAGAQTDNRAMGIQKASQSERRIALVIGNSNYSESPLLNPANDARDMAQTLRGLGFEVIHGENLSQNDMKRNMRAFGDKIRNGGVGLFYYAGHGIQISGRNYLIPIGAAISNEEEVEYESVDVGLVLAQMENARNRLNIVILDACRNNPFARSFRSTQKGLASIDAPGGTIIAYATAPGSVASDGTGRNGLYTQELLKHIQMSELNIEQVFKQVRIAVRSKTQGKQIPWESSSLEGDFYFSASVPKPDAIKSNTSPAFDPASIELSFWESIKNSGDADDFKAYLEKYPGGAFVALARNKIRSLETSSKPPATNPNVPVGSKPKTGTGASPLPLRGFEFDTVMVNSSGSVTNRRKGQAQYFTEDISGVPLEMVEIPGGTFLIGTASGDVGKVAAECKRYIPDDSKWQVDEWVKWETPQHTVKVPSLYMGKFEVTQAQWRAVSRLPKVIRDLPSDPSKFKGDNLPVEWVSWEDAVEFCERLSRSTGRQYRLPTEAEWEYACRAGATTQFAFGDTITPELVNYHGNYPYGAASKGSYRQQTMAVGGLGIANAFGLFDVHGNVWEWCLDTWHRNYDGAPGDGSVWEGGDTYSRVVRGGSWKDFGCGCRAAYRFAITPVFRLNYVGFRLVLAVRTR